MMTAAKIHLTAVLLLFMPCAVGFADSNNLAYMNRQSPPEASWEEDKETYSRDFSFRLSYGSAPGIEEEASNGDEAIEPDGGRQLEILWVRRFWGEKDSSSGWLLGSGLFFTQHRGVGREDGSEYENWAFGFLVEGGGIVRWGDHVVFELAPYAGLGTDVIGAFGGAEGGYYIYGIKGGAFVLLGSTVGLGLEVGYGGYSVEYATYSGDDIRIAGVVSLNY